MQDAISAPTADAETDLRQHPFSAEANCSEVVLGLIITQHSGQAKANQYYLRGFNLDHGTDFFRRSRRSTGEHAHTCARQGWADLNFITPELVDFYKGRTSR